MKLSLPALVPACLLAFSLLSPELAAQADAFARVPDLLRPDVIREGDPAYRLAERMAHYQLPGLSLAVVDDFALAGTAGFGKVATGRPAAVTPATNFQAASISKLVNAVAVLRLVEEGKVDLDRDVNDYLTSWQLAPSPKFPGAMVTPRMLLSHTAGLSTHGFPGYAAGKALPPARAVLEKSKGVNSDRVRIVREPGKAFKYSGGGTTILQVLVEDVTGMPYEQFLQTTVLQPLGMDDSFYSVNQAGREDGLATAHSAQGKPLRGRYHRYPESAAAGLWTTPGDLAKLMVDLLRGHRGDDGTLLRPATIRAMLAPPVAGEGNALGVFLRPKADQVYFEHGGSNEGFRAMFVANAATGQGAVVMVNGEQFDLIPEVLNAVAVAYEWPGWLPPDSVLPADFRVDKEAWKPYVGHYVSEGAGEKRSFDISIKKGQLRMARPGAWNLALVPLSQERYVLQGANPPVRVELRPDGSLRVTQGEARIFRKEE